MKWSEEAWQQVDAIYRQILKLPFVTELSEGTLAKERFDFYIAQDALYLDNYSRVLAHIASRIPSKSHSEAFLRFALDGVLVEKALHESFLGPNKGNASPTPTCRLYMDFEASKAFAPVEVEAASTLPCFWVYQRVGSEIIRKSRKDNPYSRWIETYADETFAAATERAIEICDELAAKTTPEIRESMTEAFVYATKMELMFWDSAYKFEKWTILIKKLTQE